MRRQRAVRSNDLPRTIVHHDVVADRVDVFHPLPFRTLQLRKPSEVLQRQRCMARQCMQQPLFVTIQPLSLSNQAKCSQSFVVASRDAHEHRRRPFRRSFKRVCDFLRNRPCIHLVPVFPRTRKQPLPASTQCRPVRFFSEMQFRFAPAINRHSSPDRVQHPRGSQRKLFQKVWQVARLRRLDREFHQFFRVFRNGRWRRRLCTTPKGASRRNRFWCTHRWMRWPIVSVCETPDSTPYLLVSI